MEPIKVEIPALREKIISSLTNVGIPVTDAEIVADSLIDAEIKGISTHGLMRLKPYIDNIRNKRISAIPKIEMNCVGNGMFLVDGGNGLGQVVTMHTLQFLIQHASSHGCALAVIRNSNHFGTAGFYTRLAARQGYLALITTSASATMPPFGGLDPKLGTNPFAVSFPAGRYDNFTLDVATSAVARGKIRLYEQKNQPIPLGWAIDAQGNDTTDAKAALNGGILPMGGHKGYGLSMVVEYLSSILSGANLCYETKSMFANTSVPANNGHFLAVIDISRFGDIEAINQRTEEWFNEIKDSRIRPGFKEILIPGELETRKELNCNGTVSVEQSVLQELSQLGVADELSSQV